MLFVCLTSFANIKLTSPSFTDTPLKSYALKLFDPIFLQNYQRMISKIERSISFCGDDLESWPSGRLNQTQSQNLPAQEVPPFQQHGAWGHVSCKVQMMLNLTVSKWHPAIWWNEPSEKNTPEKHGDVYHFKRCFTSAIPSFQHGERRQETENLEHGGVAKEHRYLKLDRLIWYLIPHPPWNENCVWTNQFRSKVSYYHSCMITKLTGLQI